MITLMFHSFSITPHLNHSPLRLKRTFLTIYANYVKIQMMKRRFRLLIFLSMIVLITIIFAACGDKTEFTVKYLASEGGSIVGQTEQCIVSGKNASSVTAEPDTGYEFDSWSDGVATATREDKNIQDNLNVTASFKVKEYTLTYRATEGGEITGLPDQKIEHGQDAYFAIALACDGYDFLGWSDGVETAERRDMNVQSDITVTALFKIREYTVTYKTNGNGRIEGKTSQTLKHGQDAEPVTAIPNEGYYFVFWFDRNTNPERHDVNVKQNIEVSAIFAIKKFSIKYSATEGGYIEGLAEQNIPYGSISSTVGAVAQEEYEFVKWSDGVTTPQRTEYDVKAEIDVTAIFQKKQYTLQYSAHNGGKVVGDKEQTVYYKHDAQPVTAIPSTGYEFVCWSDGVSTATRHDTSLVMDKDVRAVFVTKETPVFRLMMVFATELHINLETAQGQMVKKDYVITETEKAIYELIPPFLCGYLNDAFAGKVKFIVDPYFTTEPIVNDYMQWGSDSGFYSYGLVANDIPELQDKLNLYNSFLTIFSMDDYDNLLHSVAGSAGKKYGYVHAESLFSAYIKNDIPLESVLNFADHDSFSAWEYMLLLCLHEFSHTVERGLDGVIGIHNALKQYTDIHGPLGTTEDIMVITLFLKDELEFEGGIPYSYWVDNTLTI